MGAFEFGNAAATLLILRASELLAPGRGHDSAVQVALLLYAGYNLAAALISVPAAISQTDMATCASFRSGSRRS